MTTYCLEMRSTADWSDVRYREYTTSAKKAELFKDVPKVRFTDSGHGIVPHVREHRGARQPRNMMLRDHVVDAIKAMTGQSQSLRPPIAKTLEAALKPFVDAYLKAACPVGDSDLDDEQPRSVWVTLGDCRKAQRALWEIEALRRGPSPISHASKDATE